jgi:hypothetical protein
MVKQDITQLLLTGQRAHLPHARSLDAEGGQLDRQGHHHNSFGGCASTGRPTQASSRRSLHGLESDDDYSTTAKIGPSLLCRS